MILATAIFLAIALTLFLTAPFGKGISLAQASAENNPATGLPTISGTAQVGETLTANITGIADADGLSGETFTYQWVSSDGTTDTDIEKATDLTYKLAASDQGRSVKVRVTFTDDGGNEETLTSAPTAPVLGDGLPGAPRNLTATPGNKEITLSWDPPDDNGNAPATRYRIEWRVDGKDYDKNQWGTSRSTTYTTNDQANLANGVKYFFRVKAGNGSGNSYGPYGPASEEVSATPTSGSAVDLGTPVLSDTENLHHRMIRLDWQDIEDAGWYVVQYYHLEDGEWLDLPAEGVDIAFHGSSAVVSNLHGLSWLRVGAASCDGASEWSQIEELYGTNASDWEGVPVPEVEEGDQTEPCPVVLGTPVLSEPEYLHHSMVQLDWEDIEDAGWYVVQYYHLEGGEWLDLPAEGVDIAFHGSSAVVSNLHGLSWLRVGAASCDGASEWSQIEELYGTNASDWEGVPVPEVEEGDEIEPCDEDPDTPDNSPATGAPTISGTAQVGETLTADTSGIADTDGLSTVQYEYQWLADDADISGATNATYTLAAEDEGKAIKVQVSFTDDAGNEETLTSANTATVEARANSPATGLPAISGTAQVGETLTANTSGVADVDGLSNVQYEYQWLANDSDISGATNATYTLAAADEGKAVKVQVSFTDDAGNDETLTSEPTAVVAAALPPPPENVRAVAKKSGAVELTWDSPQDSTVIGYRIERRPTGGSPSDQQRSAGSPRDHHTLVEDTGSTDTVYTDNTAERGVGYEYRVSARNEAGAGAESDWVNAEEATASNSPATGLPSISGTAQVGETLTADTSAIADADGRSGATFSYQWVANDGNSDTDITGATDSTYTLAAADEGKTIKVKVSFTDDADNEETLTSVATTAVAGAVDSGGPSYITVEVTEDSSDPINIVTNFAITWSDADVCSVDYNAYLNIKPTYLTDDETEGSQLHLGSAASDGAQITAGLTGVQGGTRGFDVELYCGTDGSGRLVSRVDIPWGPIHPKPGTYSSEPPLSALSVSHGTMTPTFQGGTSFYTVPDIANAETRITITATPKEGYHVKFFEGSDSFVFGLIGVSVGPDAPSGLSDECGRSYSDFFGQLYERTDADLDTPGFQMDLFDGKNYVWVRVYPNAVCTLGKGYLLMITRAEGEISLPRPNTPASYTPTISGRVGVWLTLTADTLQVRDRDGLTNATFNYQWLADDAEISGATGSSYTVAAADQGKSLKVQVSFTDDRGGNEIVTSEAAVVPYGVPRITGTTEVGQTLHADVSGIGDPNGWDESTFSYQWLADDAEITGATDFSYLVADTDLGKTLKVRVSFTDGRGNEETLTSHATRVVRLRNFLPTGKPFILGTAEVGQTLRVDVSGISDPNGMTNAAFTYQWMNTGWTDSNEYTLEDRDEGRRIWLRAAYTDDAGHRHVLESPSTGRVAARPSSPATGAPTISGTAQVGETLTADTSGIADADGLANATFSYQWLADDTDIAGATGLTYTLTDSEESKAIKVEVSFTDDADNAETLTSAATAAVTAAPPSITPGEPQNLELTPVAVGTNGVGIKVFWDAPSATGGSDISGYRIQWKGGNQDYPDDQETRQAFVENAPYTIDTSSPSPIEGDELTVRVTAVNGAGAGVWTEKVGWLPENNTDLELWLLMKEYADEKQTTFPWVLETWNYLDRYEVPVEVGPTPGLGGVPLLPCVRSYTDGDDGLKECHIRNITILQIEDPKPRVIIHEMAHAYTLANRVTDAPVPLAIGHLYFDSLNLQGGLRGCEPLELYADVLTMLTLDIDKSSYWKTCNGDNAQREAQALAVLRSAVNGEMPQWFADTYTDSEGEVDLEHLWTDVQDLPGREWNVVIYQLRNAFGGYCNNELTWKSVDYSDDNLTQPWVDGGCPPPEPSSLKVTAGNGELTLAWDAPASDGDSDVDGYIVQWRSGYQFYYGWAARQRRAVLDSPTSLTYTISGLTNGVEYDVRVRAYNHIGPGQPLDVESVTPSEAAIPENTPATGAPTISGTAQVGETLTANTTGVADADGLSNVQYEYQWLADDTDIAGATGSTYTLADTEESKAITVQVSFTDDADNEETLTSAATDVVDARPNSPATGAPMITGTAQVGETLTANTSGVADVDGLSNVQYEYQWLADDADIAGATGSTYTLTDGEESKAITVQVSFTDDADNEETLTSAATGAVDARPNSPATGAPTITGTAQVGQTLTADTSGIADADGLSNVQYEYQWLADGADIAGATGLTYTLTDSEENKPITVQVSFTDDADNEETLTSAATAAVAGAQPTEPPAKPEGLEATATHDSVTLTWDDPGDDTITGYVILRRIPGVDPQGHFDVLVADTGTTATSYTDDTVAAETRYTYRIKAINGAGTSERSRWSHIDTPAAPVPDKPTGLEATESHGQVVLTWDDSGDDSITGYVILRRVRENDTGGDFSVLVANTGSAATTYTDDTVAANTTYTYRIKAINEHGTSERSRWYHIDIPAAP